MPPEKNMVNMINIIMGFLNITRFLDRKYAPRDVIKISRTTPTVRMNSVFIYPLLIIGFANTLLYASKLKPRDLNNTPVCWDSRLLSLKDATPTYHTG